MESTKAKISRLVVDSGLPRTDSGLTATSGKADGAIKKMGIRPPDFLPSPGKILLPSTIGIPLRSGSPESRLRDPRFPWAPAVTISGKNDQPFITEQYQKKAQLIADKSQQVQMNSKMTTDADLSHLTRLGSDKSRLPISFLPHNITAAKQPMIGMHTGPGPASYQHYKGYYQMGEEFIYPQQPRVRMHSLIGPKVKRERRYMGAAGADTNEKAKMIKETRPFWTTIGTRTYNSRLPNAPIPAIHHRFNMTLDMEEEKKNKMRGATMPGPAMYPMIEETEKGKCSARGVTIAPRLREKRASTFGPGPARIERELLDKGYNKILKMAPAFSLSSRWSPYSHTYTAEDSDNFF